MRIGWDVLSTPDIQSRFPTRCKAQDPRINLAPFRLDQPVAS